MVGMTYNNVDDSMIQIPRDLFQARQRELAEATCINKPISENMNRISNNASSDASKIVTNDDVITDSTPTSTSNDFNLIFDPLDKNDAEPKEHRVVTKHEILTTVAMETLEMDLSNLRNDPVVRTSCIVPNPNIQPNIKPSEDNGLCNYQNIINIPLSPQLKFTQEERNRVDKLLELEQSHVVSFNDLEYDVASKVNKFLYNHRTGTGSLPSNQNKTIFEGKCLSHF